MPVDAGFEYNYIVSWIVFMQLTNKLVKANLSLYIIRQEIAVSQHHNAEKLKLFFSKSLLYAMLANSAL